MRKNKKQTMTYKELKQTMIGACLILFFIGCLIGAILETNNSDAAIENQERIYKDHVSGLSQVMCESIGYENYANSRLMNDGKIYVSCETLGQPVETIRVK